MRTEYWFSYRTTKRCCLYDSTCGNEIVLSKFSHRQKYNDGISWNEFIALTRQISSLSSLFFSSSVFCLSAKWSSPEFYIFYKVRLIWQKNLSSPSWPLPCWCVPITSGKWRLRRKGSYFIHRSVAMGLGHLMLWLNL